MNVHAEQQAHPLLKAQGSPPRSMLAYSVIARKVCRQQMLDKMQLLSVSVYGNKGHRAAGLHLHQKWFEEHLLQLQGRKRQEGYIGKLLMSLSPEQQEELDNLLNSMRRKAHKT